MKKIQATKEIIQKLEKLFNVSYVTIYAALNYASQNERAGKIRKAALGMGATEWQRVDKSTNNK